MGARRSAPFCWLPGIGVFCVLVLAAHVPGVVATACAADQKTVEGIVESVSGNHVSIDRRSYNLEGVAITNPSGKRLSIADVVRGRKVALSIQSGVLRSVLVYDPMVE